MSPFNPDTLKQVLEQMVEQEQLLHEEMQAVEDQIQQLGLQVEECRERLVSAAQDREKILSMRERYCTGLEESYPEAQPGKRPSKSKPTPGVPSSPPAAAPPASGLIKGKAVQPPSGAAQPKGEKETATPRATSSIFGKNAKTAASRAASPSSLEQTKAFQSASLPERGKLAPAERRAERKLTSEQTYTQPPAATPPPIEPAQPWATDAPPEPAAAWGAGWTQEASSDVLPESPPDQAMSEPPLDQDTDSLQQSAPPDQAAESLSELASDGEPAESPPKSAPPDQPAEPSPPATVQEAVPPNEPGEDHLRSINEALKNLFR